jgi:hypothetical protein
MHHSKTLEIAYELNLNTRYLDASRGGETYCPGFRLWQVAVNGENYLMAGDNESSVETRVIFRITRDEYNKGEITLIGDNPDVEQWDKEYNAYWEAKRASK